MQAPFTPLLPLLHQLLQDRGHTAPALPFSQLPDEAANLTVLQTAGFNDVKVLMHCKKQPLFCFVCLTMQSYGSSVKYDFGLSTM